MNTMTNDMTDYSIQPTNLDTLLSMASCMIDAIDDAYARKDYQLARKLQNSHDTAVERARSIAFGGL